MKKSKRCNNHYILIVVAVAIAVGVYFFTGADDVSTGGEFDEFAQCLTDSGAKMYGAYWCGHCKNQKKAFGDSFQYVDYTECDAQGEGGDPSACQAAGITGYPTWVFADGESAGGNRPFEFLSEKTGCALH